MTTPKVCANAMSTVLTLRPVGMRRSSSRSGRTGIALALSRSVGRTSGSRSLDGTIVTVMRSSYISRS